MKVSEIIITESMNFTALKLDKEKNQLTQVFRNDVTSQYDYDHPDFSYDKMIGDYEYKPPENKNYDPSLDVNLSNVNMQHIMRDILGFKADEYGYTIPIDTFIKTANQWTMRNSEPSAATKTEVERGMVKRTDPNTGMSSIGRGATMIGMGRKEGYDQQLVQRMLHVAIKGRQHGATHVSAD